MKMRRMKVRLKDFVEKFDRLTLNTNFHRFMNISELIEYIRTHHKRVVQLVDRENLQSVHIPGDFVVDICGSHHHALVRSNFYILIDYPLIKDVVDHYITYMCGALLNHPDLQPIIQQIIVSSKDQFVSKLLLLNEKILWQSEKSEISEHLKRGELQTASSAKQKEQQLLSAILKERSEIRDRHPE